MWAVSMCVCVRVRVWMRNDRLGQERNVRYAVFRTYISMLRTYRDFIIFPTPTMPHPPENFNAKAFLKKAKQPEDSHEFFAQLFATQAFQVTNGAVLVLLLVCC
jgi:hypothetical protein